jgi:hypothetical protein
MMKKLFSICLLFNLYTVVMGQHRTPDQFMGYELGSKFAYHHQIIAYYKEVEQAQQDRMKLISYGTSNEGRPLMVAVLTSPGNFLKLEKLRLNHLNSIRLENGKADAPDIPIIWLSYNVHGNEAASAHTSMQVLNQLLDKTNASSQHILANSIVIMDPCLNPDGYARYTEWYNRYQNQIPDVTPYALEHNEPWPGGRYNHYLFDLNRDWAWQTQVETQQRVALYQQWMPHVHADFHEMGYERSYFFPPAAKPFHQDITAWQRQLGEMVGERCRQYFDKNGWTYFTREDYDLFYPSYGDTWPTFNGALGITYEQGGSGGAGLGIRRIGEQDTLTLKNRMAHHFVTSIATLESVVSQKKRVTEEFIKYHEDALERPSGEYKSYIIKTENQGSKVKSFTNWLDKQGFQYGIAGKNMNVKATQLAENIDKQLEIQKEDLVISAYQPKSNLLKVLFESKPVLEDSITYDLTSWSVAYLFGLEMYGSKEKLKGSPRSTNKVQHTLPTNKPYAYVVGWNGVHEVAFLTALFKKNIIVKTANEPFEIDQQKFVAGSLIILQKDNTHLSLDQTITTLADTHQVAVTAVQTGFMTSGMDFGSDQVKVLKSPKVVVVAGEGIVPYALGVVWNFFEKQIQHPLTLVQANKLSQIPWHEVDVLILPDGKYQDVLNDRVMTQLREWVKNGGKLIVMEKATNQFLAKPGFGLVKKHLDLDPKPKVLKKYGDVRREEVNNATYGSMFRVEMDLTHPLAFGCAPNYYTLVGQSYQMDYLKTGWNVGYFTDQSYRAGFVGKNIKSHFKNTLIMGVEEMGGGEVIYLMDNPLFRNILSDGQLLFGNAVFR